MEIRQTGETGDDELWVVAEQIFQSAEVAGRALNSDDIRLQCRFGNVVSMLQSGKQLGGGPSD